MTMIHRIVARTDKPAAFPRHDIFTLVTDHGKAGVCLNEASFAGRDALRTVADVLECLDDNTVGVVRINLNEGRIDDVSEDVAQAWMKSEGIHHEWGYRPCPSLIAVHCADAVEQAETVAEYQREDNARFHRIERQYRQRAAL